MSYSLTLGNFVPDITYTVSPDNQSVDIGDSITITATIHRIPSCVLGGKTCTEHGMQIRAVACVPSYRNTRRGQKTNPSGVPYYPISSTLVSFMACTQEVYQSNVQFTIDVDSRLLAGLRTTVAEAVKIGFVVTEYYLVPGISEEQNQSFSGDVLTNLTISTYGYTMPTLTTMHYSDMSSKDPLTVVGNYVQNESIINLAYNTGDIYYEFKEDDSSSTCYMDFTIYNQNGDIVFDNTGNDVRYWLDSSSEGESIELPTGSLVSGTYTWNLVIEFEYGATGITTGSYVVLPYSQPELSFEITRYSEVIGDVTTYEESDDGENVWVDYEAVVSQLSGSNTCSLTLTYTPNDNGGVLPMTLFSSNSGGTFTPQHGPHDRTILTSTFSSSNTYVFTATLSDVLNSYEVVVYAYRATAFFNIEKNGVAVGMRSTGKENEYDSQTGDLVTVNKKFEVASDYTSHFYGGIETLAVDWKLVTDITTLGTGVGTPGTTWSNSKLRIGRIGNHVYMRGGVSLPANNYSNSGKTRDTVGVTIANLPMSYMPSNIDEIADGGASQRYFAWFWLCPISGSSIACVTLNLVTGRLFVEWVRAMSNGSVVTSAIPWVELNIDWWID